MILGMKHIILAFFNCWLWFSATAVTDAAAAPAASSQTIKVELVQRQFEFSLTQNYLFMRSSRGDGGGMIKRTPCSERLIQDFWSSAVRAIQGFPIIKSDDRAPAAEVNGKRRLLISLRGRSASVAHLDGRFRGLQFQEAQKCRSK